LVLFFAWPVISLVGRGFFDDGQFSMDGVAQVVASGRTWRIVGQTLSQSLVGTLLAVLLGIPGAYVLYRMDFPGRKLLRALVSVPFVLPSVVVGVAFSSLISENGWLGFLGLKETFAAVVAALVFFNYSLVVRQVGVLWARLDDRQAQAALTLGASPMRVLFTVTLPALLPAIASAASLTFLFCASAFGVVLVLGGISYGTIETEIYYQTAQSLNLPVAAALSILQLVIVSICLLISNRARTRSELALKLNPAAPSVRRGRKGTVFQSPPGDDPKLRSWQRRRRASSPVYSSGWKSLSVALTAISTLLVGLPLTSLLYRSLQTKEGLGIGNYLALMSKPKALTVSVWEATRNSLTTASAAAAIALALGFLVCFVLSRNPRSKATRLALSFLDSAFMLPLGVSAVTVGFGFLITLNRPPVDLRGSWLLIPIAQAMVALPLVVRTLLPTWRGIDPRLRQAAATLGAGPGRILCTVDLPLVARAFGLAVGLSFATSLGEFGATTFLARPDAPTLPVAIYRLSSRPGVENLGMAMAASVLLAVLTALVMAAAEALSGEKSRI
jgi:thiamine transport system permease protein